MTNVANSMWIVFILATLHFIGDYVLQGEFIAKTKGENWYHLFVHSTLYAFPFWLVFKFSWPLIAILVTHLIVDALKARYKKISYFTDQTLHFSILFFVYTVWAMR